MSPILLHAAAFDPVMTGIALIEPYVSYGSLVLNPFYNADFIHSTVAGALKSYDLPELMASLAPRKLMIAGITDCQGNIILPDSVQVELDKIRAAYQYRHATEQLSILPGKAGGKSEYPVLDWMK
jgi:hypothetical protein